jgi:hypothetical protein
MRLHSVAGFSPLLILKAMKAHNWSEVVLYTPDRNAFENIFRNTENLPPIKYVRIGELNDSHSVEDYLSNFRLAMSFFDKVSEDDILFYSGPPMAMAVAYLMRGFSTYMTYNSHERRFVCLGAKNDHFDDHYLPSIEEYLRLHGLELCICGDDAGRASETLEIKTFQDDGRAQYVMRNIKEIGFNPLGIQITLHKPPTSGQRKSAIYDIFRLRTYIGPHALKVYVDDSILAGWINGLYPLVEVEE